MTTTGSLFFSFQLPGLYGSGAYVFSSGNRNSRIDLGEVASAWITEVYGGRANRGRHLPSEKVKVVCRKGWTPRSMSSAQTLRICVSSFNVFIVITCERVCGSCWQTALQPCLIIALLVCSRVATLVPITWSSLNVSALVYSVVTVHVSPYDMWWCPELHVDRPGYANPWQCQLCQTLGGI